ncbi:MFS transporter [Microcoleus sp. FACHB-1515]|nr:MFS transporter [Microcoleus sp. FACHB-1515]
MDVLPADVISPKNSAIVSRSISTTPPVALSPATSKAAIRTSLRASTADGVFATIFSNIAGGVLLSNFLVELHATPVEIGMLASIPMLANLLQPIGAYFSERSTSRHYYCLWIYGPSRLLWLILVGAIALFSWGKVDTHQLVNWTLAIVFVTHFLGAFGSAAWLSWLAVLVPRRLRGRYFGFRNSAASLTNLLSVPILGWLVSAWRGGSIAGYGIILLFGIVAGIVSLSFQFFMVDVNPQVQHQVSAQSEPAETLNSPVWFDVVKDANFLRFLLYISVWMFAVNLSAPFFNLYLLDNLSLNIRWVTLYNSLAAGANMIMLVVWGRIADRVGNRPLLLLSGILVAITPLLWLGTSTNAWSLWLWLPALHLFTGGTWAAIDLCSNNLQIGVAPTRNQASFFAIAAAVAGVSGAIGTTTGGLLTQFANYGGLPGLFALSSVVRLVALLPLIFVHERHGQSLNQVMQVLFPGKKLERVNED